MNIDTLCLKYQHNIDCCAPIACLHAIELISGKTFSSLYVYYMARKLQGTLHLQKCQLKNVLLALEKYGVCEEHLWPFDKQKVDTAPSSDAIFNGIHNRLHKYEVVTSIDHYLQQDIPVIVGMSIGELFVNSPKRYKPINGSDNKYISSHAALIVGSTDTGWILANSFGPKWGDHGYCILPFECDVDIGERYAITSFVCHPR